MLLRPGEVDPVGPGLAGRHDHQVRLWPALDPDRRLVAAAVDDRIDQPERGERLDQGRRLVGLGEDVEVADRLLAAAEGSGRLHRMDARGPRQRLDQRRHQLLGPIESHPVEPLVEPGDPLEHQRLGLGRHPAHASQATSLRGPAQVVHGLDAELGVQLANGLGSEAGDAQQLDEAGRDLGPEPVVVRHVARRDELADLVADGLADTRDGRRVPGPVGRREVDRAAADGIGRPVIGDGLEHELALQFEDVADRVEDPGEVAVGQVSRVGHHRMVAGAGRRIRACPLRRSYAPRVRSLPAHGRRLHSPERRLPDQRQAATTRSRPARFAR